jgi:hypothetical protein
MWDWIVIGVLYAVGIGFFRLLGGIGAAAEALQTWGRASSTVRNKRAASPGA